MDERESIISFILARADQHIARSANPDKPQHVSYHKGTAVLFRALAGDIRAELDRA